MKFTFIYNGYFIKKLIWIDSIEQNSDDYPAGFSIHRADRGRADHAISTFKCFTTLEEAMKHIDSSTNQTS